MNARQTKAQKVRRQVKLRQVEAKMSAAINAHHLLEPLQCDVEFMGEDYLEKRRRYRDRHERLLQAFAELTCERLKLTETNEDIK